MSNFEYLPGKSDWRFWIGISKEMQVLRSSKREFQLIEPDYHRFLMVLVRQVLEDHPPFRDEVVKEINEDYWQRISDYDLLDYPGATKKSQIRMVSGDLKALEARELRYLKVYKTKAWEQEFQTKTRSPHGSAALYQITGRGVLAFECALGLPVVAISLRGYKKTGFGIADSFVNYGILARPERLRWSRDYLNKHQFRIGRFHEKVLTEIEEILGGKQDLFWQMSSPQVLLLREYYNLRELMHWNRDEFLQEKENVARKKRSKKAEDQWGRYTKITASSYSESLKTVSIFAEAVIEKFILPRWRNLGFSATEIEQHLPESDAVITG